jgi:hypothetical protein
MDMLEGFSDALCAKSIVESRCSATIFRPWRSKCHVSRTVERKPYVIAPKYPPRQSKGVSVLQSTMAWYDSDSWLSRAWGPYLSTIIITLIITLTLPILLHYYLYRSRTLTTTPTFLVVGPSGAGKTAFITKVGIQRHKIPAYQYMS